MSSIGLDILVGNGVDVSTGALGNAATDITVGVPVGPRGPRGSSHVRTVADIMNPFGSIPLGPEQVRVTSLGASPPAWWATNVSYRWDDASDPFLYPRPPKPYGYWVNGVGNAATGCEFSAGNGSPKAMDVDVIVTGKKFAVRFLAYANTGDVMFWFDGNPVAAQPIEGIDTVGFGAWNWVQFDFDQVESHRLRIAGPTVFFGIDYDPTSPVFLAKPHRPATMVVISDSYWEANGSGEPGAYVNSPDILFRTLTGIRVLNLAQGGTGLLNNGNGPDGSGVALPGVVPYPGSPYTSSHFGSADNLAALAAADYDIGLMNGSGNDGLPFPKADVLQAARDFFSAVQTLHPGKPWIWMGIEPVSWFRAAQSADRQADYALLAAGLSNVTAFVDSYNEQWLTGTGDVGTPVGDGNQDYMIRSDDHIHPNTVGFNHLMRLLVAAIQTAPIEMNDDNA